MRKENPFTNYLRVNAFFGLSNMIKIIALCFVFLFCACSGPRDPFPTLELYGFNTNNTSYVTDQGFSEYSQYSNIYTIAPDTYDKDALISLLQQLTASGIKPVLVMENLLFRYDSIGKVTVNPDYESFLNTLKQDLGSNISLIKYFYLIDEPIVHNLTNSDLATVADAVKSNFPKIPIAVVESGSPQFLDKLVVPASVDIIGIDIYGVKNPNTDAGYQTAWKILHSKLNTSQKIVVIAQAFWCTSDPWPASDMDIVSNNYYELARNDEKVIGILEFQWESPPDLPTCIGAKDLDTTFKNTNKAIGCLITKRC